MKFISKLCAPFSTIIKNKEMIVELSKKEIRDKYKGQPLGMFWALFHPLVLIAIYIFLFGVVYQTRMSTAVESTMSYTAYLLSGMIPWLCIQGSLSGGSVSVISNATFIKQVIFPVEVFPIKAVGAQFIIELIYLLFDIIYCIISARTVMWTYILLPALLIIQLVFLIGINYIVASVAVYLKDVKDIVQVICMVGIYFTPVIYMPEAVPSIFQAVMYVNPFSHYIWIAQDVLFYGHIVHWYSWCICIICSLVMLYLGHYIYQKLKIGFGSAL